MPYADPEVRREYNRRYQRKNPERGAVLNSAYRDRLRAQVLEHYGAVCACCGEDSTEFLSVDHIGEIPPSHFKPDGRRKLGATLYREIIREGYPDTVRLACFNCNNAKSIYGVCPHVAAVAA